MKKGGGDVISCTSEIVRGIGKQFDSHIKIIIQFQFNFITDNKRVAH